MKLYLIQVFILFILYYLSAKIGLSFDAVSGYATLVWAPTGIALAALILFGYSLWVGVFLGAFLINYSIGASIPLALGIAIGNSLEALIGAYLLNKSGFNPTLEKLKDAIKLITLSAIFCTLISSFIGTSSLFLSSTIRLSSFRPTFLAWWIGDMLGSLTIAPLILIWFSRKRVMHKGKKLVELCLAYALLIFITLIVFGPDNTQSLPIGYLTIPPLVYLAIRFSPFETSLGIFILSVIAIWGTSMGYGVFIKPRLSDDLLLLEGFIGTHSVVFLILSTAIEESKQLALKKDIFVNIASHELKTPITVIKGYAQLLYKSPKLDKRLALYIKKMDDEIKGLIKLVNELLDFSRIGSERLALEYETFSLNQLIIDSIKNINQLYINHRIVFQGKNKVLISADKYRINQVITNLLTNAIKFSPNYKKILVQLKKEKETVTISVKDFGIGIAPKHQKDIFSRFFQVDTQYSMAGLGLGLYISSEIIRKHQGKIWVESQEGKGATFFFTLPLKQD